MDRVECGHRERPAMSAARTATRRRPAVSRAHAFNEAFALDLQSQRFAPPHDWAQSSNEKRHQESAAAPIRDRTQAEGQDAEGPESLVVQYNIDWGLLSAAAVTTAICSPLLGASSPASQRRTSSTFARARARGGATVSARRGTLMEFVCKLALGPRITWQSPAPTYPQHTGALPLRRRGFSQTPGSSPRRSPFGVIALGP